MFKICLTIPFMIVSFSSFVASAQSSQPQGTVLRIACQEVNPGSLSPKRHIVVFEQETTSIGNQTINGPELLASAERLNTDPAVVPVPFSVTRYEGVISPGGDNTTVSAESLSSQVNSIIAQGVSGPEILRVEVQGEARLSMRGLNFNYGGNPTLRARLSLDQPDPSTGLTVGDYTRGTRRNLLRCYPPYMVPAPVVPASGEGLDLEEQDVAPEVDGPRFTIEDFGVES